MPPRVSASDMWQKIELGFFALIGTLNVSAITVSAIFMVTTHPEHLSSAISTFFSLALFVVIVRLYIKDELQDRKIVYLAAFVCLTASCSALIYAAHWGSCDASSVAPTSAPSCPNGYYSHSTGVCITLSYPRDPSSYPCYLLNQNRASVWNMSALYNSPYVTRNSFGNAEALAIYNACFKKAKVTYSISNCTRQ